MRVLPVPQAVVKHKQLPGKYSCLKRELSLAVQSMGDERVCMVTASDDDSDTKQFPDFEVVTAHSAGGYEELIIFQTI